MIYKCTSNNHKMWCVLCCVCRFFVLSIHLHFPTETFTRFQTQHFMKHVGWDGFNDGDWLGFELMGGMMEAQSCRRLCGRQKAWPAWCRLGRLKWRRLAAGLNWWLGWWNRRRNCRCRWAQRWKTTFAGGHWRNLTWVQWLARKSTWPHWWSFARFSFLGLGFGGLSAFGPWLSTLRVKI